MTNKYVQGLSAGNATCTISEIPGMRIPIITSLVIYSGSVTDGVAIVFSYGSRCPTVSFDIPS